MPLSNQWKGRKPLTPKVNTTLPAPVTGEPEPTSEWWRKALPTTSTPAPQVATPPPASTPWASVRPGLPWAAPPQATPPPTVNAPAPLGIIGGRTGQPWEAYTPPPYQPTTPLSPAEPVTATGGMPPTPGPVQAGTLPGAYQPQPQETQGILPTAPGAPQLLAMPPAFQPITMGGVGKLLTLGTPPQPATSQPLASIPVEGLQAEEARLRAVEQGGPQSALGTISERLRKVQDWAQGMGIDTAAVELGYLSDAAKKGWVSYLGEYFNVGARAIESTVSHVVQLPTHGSEGKAAQELGIATPKEQWSPEERSAIYGRVAELRRQGWKPKVAGNTVAQYATQTYGDTPQTESAMSYADAIWASGGDRQKALVDRVMTGDDPIVASIGRKVNLMTPTADDLKAYRQYITSVEARGEDVTAARQQVEKTGYIPGEGRVFNELAANILFDPTNLVDLRDVLKLYGPVADIEKANAKWVEAAQVATETAARSADVVEPLAQVAGEITDPGRLAGLRSTIQSIFELTPEARAAQLYDQATPWVRGVLAEVDDPLTAAAAIQKMANDPASLGGLMGPAAASEGARESMATIKAVADNLEKAVPSITSEAWNKATFLDELETALRDAADGIVGVDKKAKPNWMQRFADSNRNLMREFYFNLNPSYPINNMKGDIGNLIYDGANPLYTVADAQAYADRLVAAAPVSQRVAGAVEGGVESTFRGKGLFEGRNIPVLSAASRRGKRVITTGQLLEGTERTLLGEETRYLWGYAQMHQRANQMIWDAYEFSPDLVTGLGKDQATRLRGILQNTLTMPEARAGLKEFIGDASKFDVSQYLDNINDLSPRMRGVLNADLNAAGSTDDVAAAFNKVREEVEFHANQTTAAGLTPAGRKVFTEVHDAQDLAETVTDLHGLGQAAGLPPEEILKGTEQVNESILTAQRAASDTPVRALRLSTEAEIEPAARRAIVQDVRNQVAALKDEARGAVDKARVQAWKDGTPQAWTGYRDFATKTYEQQFAATQKLDAAVEQAVARIRAGASVEEVLPGYTSRASDVAAEIRKLQDELATRAEVARAITGEDEVQFGNRLYRRRVGVDSAEDWAWRMATDSPDVDTMDILASADADVAELARTSKHNAEIARRAWKAKKLDDKAYIEAANRAWQPYWDQAPQRWYQAAAQVGRVRGVDVVPMLPDVIRTAGTKAGVDLSDMSKVSADGWQKTADAADEISKAAAAQVARASGAVGLTPPTQSLADMQWAGSAEDVARWMGMDPAKMTAEDWTRVAQTAREKLNKELTQALEEGRASVVGEVSKRKPTGQLTGFGKEATAGALSRKGEQEMLAQLTRQARDKEKEIADWVLKEMGYTEEEVAALSLKDSKRLVAEALEGKVALTPAGKVSKIGNLNEARRAAVLGGVTEEMRAGLQELGVLNADDLFADQAYHWGEIVNQAEERATLGANATAPKGPRLYYDHGRPSIRHPYVSTDEIDRSAGLASEAARVSGMATDRAEALARAGVVTPGEAVVPPTPGPEASRALVPYQPPTGEMAPYEAPMAEQYSPSWNATTSEQLDAQDVINAANGGFEAPRPGTVADAVRKQQMDTLDNLQAAVGNDWEKIQRNRGSGLSGDQEKLVRQWFSKEFTPWHNTRSLRAHEAAQRATDFALLDYRKRTRADVWLSSVIPYPYWYTRNGKNWAARMVSRPGLLGTYLKYRTAAKQANEQRGAPTRMERKAMVKIGPWQIGVDPIKDLFPFQAMMNVNYDDPTQAKNGVDAVFRMAGALNMRPAPWISIPLQLAGVVGGQEEIYNLLPQTSQIQAVSALARQAGVNRIPPGGYYLEAPIRRALGLPEGEPATAYRVERAAVSQAFERMQADQAVNVEGTLRAMELMHHVDDGSLRMQDAMGLPLGLLAQQMPGSYLSEKVRGVAKDLGWNEDQLKEAMMLLGSAVQRAAMERAVTTVPAMMGMPAYPYTPGEAGARGTQAELAASGYVPLTMEGSISGRRQYLKDHPEARLRPQTYQVLPGTEQGEYGPQEVINTLEASAATDRVQTEFKGKIDQTIRDQPWNTKAVGNLLGELGAETQAVNAKYYGTDEKTRLWGVVGAAPQEISQMRTDQLVSVVASSEPKLDDYMDPATGEYDFDAWRAAKTAYYANLAGTLADDETVALLATDAKKDAAGLLSGVSEESVKDYRRRNDSPLQAVQHVWNDQLYTTAWEAYRVAVDGGMTAGDAYDQYIKGLPALDATAMIPGVMAEYPGRWTRTELAQALQGVRFPDGREAHLSKMPEQRQSIMRAQDAFYTFVEANVPPGDFEWSMRDSQVMLAAITDFDTRQAMAATDWSEAQWKLALSQAQAFVNSNKGKVSGTPQEWTAARETNRQFTAQREQLFPGIGDLLAVRDSMWSGTLNARQKAERAAWEQNNPMYAQYRAFENQFASSNLEWAKYYRPWIYEQVTGQAGAGMTTGHAGAAGGGGGGASAGTSGGGTSTSASDWQAFLSAASPDVATALYRYWGEGKQFDEATQAKIEAIHAQQGFGTLEQWLAYLRTSYTATFPSLQTNARNVPNVQYTHWIQTPWSRLAR